LGGWGGWVVGLKSSTLGCISIDMPNGTRG